MNLYIMSLLALVAAISTINADEKKDDLAVRVAILEKDTKRLDKELKNNSVESQKKKWKASLEKGTEIWKQELKFTSNELNQLSKIKLLLHKRVNIDAKVSAEENFKHIVNDSDGVPLGARPKPDALVPVTHDTSHDNIKNAEYLSYMRAYYSPVTGKMFSGSPAQQDKGMRELYGRFMIVLDAHKSFIEAIQKAEVFSGDPSKFDKDDLDALVFAKWLAGQSPETCDRQFYGISQEIDFINSDTRERNRYLASIGRGEQQKAASKIATPIYEKILKNIEEDDKKDKVAEQKK